MELDAVALTGFDDGINRGGTFATRLGAGEQPLRRPMATPYIARSAMRLSIPGGRCRSNGSAGVIYPVSAKKMEHVSHFPARFGDECPER